MASQDSRGDAKIEKLNGANYTSWSYNMKLVLMERGLWSYVDGRETAPRETEKETVKKLYRYNSEKAYALISLYVDVSLQIHITNTTDPQEAWEILQNQFSFVTVNQVVRLTRKFYHTTMKEGDDLMQHITQMTMYAQQLRDLDEEISPQKFGTTILSSLPPSYEHFITSLNARRVGEMHWDSIKSSLIEEYLKRKEDAEPQRNDALVTRVNTRGNNSQQQQHQRKKCYNCDEVGHIAKFCPDNNNNTGNNNSNSNSNNSGRHWNNFHNNSNNNNNNNGRHWNNPHNNNSRRRGGEQGNFCDSFQNLSVNGDDIALVTCNSDSSPSDNDEWYIDSAASVHMTFDEEGMTDFVPTSRDVFLGDDFTLPATGTGNMRVPIYDASRGVRHLKLHEVLYVPGLKKNLLSVPAMTKMGAEVLFDNEKCTVSKDGQDIIIGHKVGDKLYKVNNKPEYATLSLSKPASIELWHQRLCHLNYNSIERLSTGEIATGISCSLNGETSDGCEPCVMGKMHKLPFPKESTTRSTQLLELVHSDLCGPMEVDSKGGSKYFLTFTDDYSRYTTTYFLQKKSEVVGKFKEYVLQMEKLTGCTLKRVRSDNGGEYTSKEYMEYCKQVAGIHHQFTNPYTPEQNGVSERYNRTVMEAARSMLFHSKLPLSFWAEAVQCATYVRNRSPTSALNNRTPYEFWYGRKPDISNLRVFGCVAYSHIPDEKRTKLQPKSEKCVFVGYPDDTKGFKLFNIESSKFIRNRNVIFHEKEFHDFHGETKGKESLTSLFPSDETEITADEKVDSDTESDASSNESDESESEDERNYEERFLDEVHNLGTRRRSSKPPERYTDSSNYVAEHCFITESHVSNTTEPETVKAALEDVNWHTAMKSEISSLHQNDTWELVPRPAMKNIVGSRWVFKVKPNPDGTVNRFKARVVAKGYSQVHGLDYSEVFSPVVRYAGIRSLLAYANANDLEVHQMDVTTAFLNGELDHEIYMEQPEGFLDEKFPAYVCKLKKSIYGLKQSARCWNATLTNFLLADGYTKSTADECIFIKRKKKNFVILAIYVDDVIPISNKPSMLEREKSKLKEKFAMVDNGPIHFMLGMVIKRDRQNRTMTIDQSEYIRNILRRFNMENCKPVAIPMDPSRKFTRTTNEDESFNITLYQQAVGCLTYASLISRPDIAAATGMLAQYMSNPSADHWSGINRVLRYLRGTIDYGLSYSDSGNNDLVGFSDADWAGDLDTRRSTSGYTFHVGTALVSWSSRKQATVARSSTEAEYVALSSATQEAIWLRRLMSDISFQEFPPTLINEDNQGAIELSKNAKHHERTKHIDIAHHFVRERVSSNEITVGYCPTQDMVADVMTKAVPRVKFEKFRSLLGVVKID